jgi:hypothetical protein
MRNQLLFWLMLSLVPATANNFDSTKSVYLKNAEQQKIILNNLKQLNISQDLTIDNQYNEIYKLIAAILWQESSNNHPKYLIGDVGKSKGPMQTSIKVMKDCNKYLGINKYQDKDRMDLIKSIEMFLIYQKQYNPTFDIEIAARIWNGGPSTLKDLKLTDKYWNSIKSKMDNQILQSKSVANKTEVQQLCKYLNIDQGTA